MQSKLNEARKFETVGTPAIVMPGREFIRSPRIGFSLTTRNTAPLDAPEILTDLREHCFETSKASSRERFPLELLLKKWAFLCSGMPAAQPLVASDETTQQ